MDKLQQIEKEFMWNKAIESGKFIIDELKGHNNICILSANEKYPHLTYWVKSLFNYFQYKDFNMEIAEETDIKNYDAAIIIELQMGMEKNNLSYKKDYLRNISAIRLIYEVTFTDEEKPDAMDYFYNGVCTIKYIEMRNNSYTS